MKRSIFQAVAVFALAAVAIAFPDLIDAESMKYAPLLFAGSILDVFKSEPFSILQLTNVINKLPFVAGRATQLLPWQESGITTFNFALESMNHTLRMVNPTPRGGPGEVIPKDGRVMRVLRVPHFERDDAVYADEVSGVREFGQEQSVQTVQGVINNRMAQHTRDMDLTLEYYRVGALKGIILNPDATTLYNLYDEFDEPAPTEVDFNLDGGDTGALREAVQGVVRTIANAMDGLPFSGVHAFCGDAFFDALIKNAEVRASYKGTPMASVLRDGYIYTGNTQKIYGVFEFGGVVWENYRGSIGGTPMIETDKCHLFPMGVAGFFRTVYAPADYVETVNTIGRPRYAKQFPMPNDKGVYFELQSNSLSFVERPGALVKGKIT